MRISKNWVLLALLVIGIETSWAQTASFTVDVAGKITAVDSALASSKAAKAKTPFAVAVKCEDKGCKDVSVTLENKKLTGTSATENGAAFVIKQEDMTKNPASVVVSRNANEKFSFQFTSEGDLSGAAAAAAGGNSQLNFDREYSKCTAVPEVETLNSANDTATQAGERQGGSRRTDGLKSLFRGLKPRVAVFIVTPSGTVLQRPVNIDEGQAVVVAVYASTTIIGDLLVRRTSALRNPAVFRAVGEGVDTSKVIIPQAKIEGEKEICGFRYWVLGDDFAPGAGAFDIRSFAANTVIGSVEFGVDPLYNGMYSLGALRSELIDPDFYLSSDGTTQTIRQRNLGDRDVLYTVMYTPFIWGKRSLQEPPPWWERFNPTVGVVLDHVGDNFVAGISYDFPVGGLVLTYGRHWRRVSKLDPSANLAPGSPFAGTIEQLPVGKEWDSDKFVALTIDLQAAVTLFQKALRTAPN